MRILLYPEREIAGCQQQKLLIRSWPKVIKKSKEVSAPLTVEPGLPVPIIAF